MPKRAKRAEAPAKVKPKPKGIRKTNKGTERELPNSTARPVYGSEVARASKPSRRIKVVAPSKFAPPVTFNPNPAAVEYANYVNAVASSMAPLSSSGKKVSADTLFLPGRGPAHFK